MQKKEYTITISRGLVSTGREMFRMEMLERIAREKVRTLALVDEIEVYLAYQNKLKESLELTSVTAEMRFFGASGVTASDLRSAERQVKAAENSEFSEWVTAVGPVAQRAGTQRAGTL
ncbi:E3 ubiquitin-protein ligase SspH2 [Salmonella enterica subsp. arizonae]|uniref:E3 ubiquitin-protein ligase SspH2 n=1 Tax=Salmonella enterica subsp. arizonae TaxID=59203 RepID=A0A379T6Q5_SALER|nr:E3 ubiquitin-protein ligase SspH2 [Salmonella enterica subsp. arizonae]